MKYSGSPREIPRASPWGFPSGIAYPSSHHNTDLVYNFEIHLHFQYSTIIGYKVGILQKNKHTGKCAKKFLIKTIAFNKLQKPKKKNGAFIVHPTLVDYGV